MDRRTFFRTLAGAALTTPVAQSHPAHGAERLDAATSTTAGRALPNMPPLPPIEFVRGKPARISLAKYLPANAERVHGGWYDELAGYHSYFGNLHGVTFDVRTRELVYDGSDPDPYHTAQNPNHSYFVGVEMPPYNRRWQWPPTRMPLPQPVNGISRALANPSKHTRPRYCPLDRRIHFFGGDFTTWGIQGAGQNGRAVMWSTDPIANDWSLDISPAGGRRGGVTPLAPDLMGFAWDRNREVFWIAYGVARPGFASEQAWKADGNASDTWPKSDQSSSRGDYPLFIVNPKLSPRRYERTAVAIPWDVQGGATAVQEIAHDGVSGRLYAIESRAQIGGIRAWHLSTRDEPLAFTYTDVSLASGSAGNLTGTNKWQDVVTGYQRLHVDEAARLLYFFDYRHPALLALTLPGNVQGEGKVRLVCELPVTSITHAAMAHTASIASAWIPEHRIVVLFWEPLWHQCGPFSASLTIDVDTSAVDEGPRFPAHERDGRPWFPNGCEWFPPTGELYVYGFMFNDSVQTDIAVPQFNVRYKLRA
jgi:hypothetical protein